jgi:hypothetical protein
MTQPPQGPYGSGDNQGEPQWGSGPGEPTWGGQPGQQPSWGQQGEPTWGGQAGQQPGWGQPAQPGGGQNYDPTSGYRPGEYNPGQYGGYQQPYGATPPPQGGGPGGPGGPGYGPPPGPKPSKTPWIIGIAVAAAVVIVLGVVLLLVLGGNDDDPKASPTDSTTTSQSSGSTDSQTSTADAEEQIETAVRTYTTAFTARDWDTAISVTCGAEQATIEDIEAKDTATVGMKLNSVTGIDVTGDSAQATVSLTFVDPDKNSDLDTNRYTFDMENRSGDWLICSTREI